MVPFGVVAMIGVAAGILAAGLPADGAGIATIALIVVAAALWLLALTERVQDLRVSVAAFVGVGLAGVGVDVLQPRGPGFVAGYMALAGLALRAPRRLALAAGVPLLLGLAAAEARGSRTPTSAVLSVALGAGFLFLASSFAALNRDARRKAEELLRQQAVAQRARERAAALAERSRLARDLHDVLAHSLSGLNVHLEATRLLAQTIGGDQRLVSEISRAQALAREGMFEAKRAVRALRGDELPGPDALPRLIKEFSATTRVPASHQVVGDPVPLGADAGLTVFRTVQEALTNVAKHAGAGATARVTLRWTPGQVCVEILDQDGDGKDSGLPSGGSGLPGLRERAVQLGGELEASPAGTGFAVRLRLPTTTGSDGAGMNRDDGEDER
jgi:signal transduction histidine kinase